MKDLFATALHEKHGLTARVAVVTGVAQQLRGRHGLLPTAAELLAQALAAAALMAGTQKGEARLNLQLECDGPLGGLFVDASAKGTLRGYVKNPLVDLKGNPGPYLWRAALGNSGFLSVLKDQGQGEFYRSSVELKAFDLAKDLGHYLAQSEQVASALALEVQPLGAEPLGRVVGALAQRLPGGDEREVEALQAELPRRLREGLAAGLEGQALAAALLGEGARPLGEHPLRFQCSCSKERVLQTLAALGEAELRALHREQGRTSVTCQLCGQRHEVGGDELLALAATAKA